MINPNRQYRSKSIATIVKLDPMNAYIPYLTVQTADGIRYEGSLERCYCKPGKLKVGDKVSFSVQFSIVADRYMLANVVKKRS